MSDIDVVRAEVKKQLERIDWVNAYELLDVSKDAKEQTIKDAFRRLARMFHVDAYPPGVLDANLQRDMLKVMGAFSRAQSTLLNPAQRAELDARIALEERGVPTDVRQIFAADESFRTGKRLLDRSAFRDARDKFAAAIAVNPSEPDYHVYLAWSEYCVLTEGDRKPSDSEARKIVARLEEIVPNHVRNDMAYVFLGNIQRNRGDDKAAAAAYHAALKTNPDNLEATSNLRLLAKRGEKQNSGSFLWRLFKKG